LGGKKRPGNDIWRCNDEKIYPEQIHGIRNQRFAFGISGKPTIKSKKKHP